MNKKAFFFFELFLTTHFCLGMHQSVHLLVSKIPGNLAMKLGIYQHYKGQHYRVIGTARHSETLEQLVVYQQLYGENNLWVRPAKMFTESVEYKSKIVPRFTFIQIPETE